MKNKVKKLISLLLSVLMVLSCTVPVFAAENDGYEFDLIGKKTAAPLVTPGQYEITVNVPGAVETDEYSEIIVMVDASSSQGANLTKLKDMLVSLAEEVLHNDGSMRLTLMGFGMGPARVGSFYNAETLEAFLKDVTQADLRQGVSATNCEAALDFVYDYIEESEKLHKTFVIFTSDGMTNMDETPFALSTWEEHPEWYMSGATKSMIASYAAGGQADLLMTEGLVLTPTAKLYPEDAVNIELAKKTYGIDSEEYSAAVDALYGKITATEEAGVAFTNAIWEDVFNEAGYTFADDVLYSTPELEKIFLDYHGGVLTNSFLCTIHGMKNASFYPDWYNLSTWGARASVSADKLAEHDKVLELYMMDFANKVKTWMNPDSTGANHCTSDKITYNTATNFSAAVDKIADLENEMFVTVYRETTVIDPMSKWVTLDPDSIRIYEDDLLIYQYGEGWLYEDKKPTAEPITLTVNEDGRYQIEWRIKDSELLYTDRYFLKYKVDVDETAEGFEHGKLYPANDPTYVEYKDINGETQIVEVEVPEVKEPLPADDFGENDKGFKIYKGSSIDGTPISEIQFDIYHVIPGEGDVLNVNPTEEEYGKYIKEENLVGSVITDSSGYGSLNLTDLGYGDGFYLVVEKANEKVKAPLDPFYVSVPMADPETQKLMDVVVMYPKNEPVIPDTPIEPDIPQEPEKDTTGKFVILKHSNLGENYALEGAQFQLYRVALPEETATMNTVYNGIEVGLIPVIIDEQPVIITSGADGTAESPELEFGLYFLVETKSPNGYNLLQDAVPVFVTETSGVISNAVKIMNTPGVHLPETGGVGTTWFIIIGSSLALAAAVILVSRRRIGKEE